ncbi:prospero homeobox 3 [Antennarius striatus]|uniref:prospero homeobox 3 n=1 Tax=Antennarius striatus TaxID=241820 RepID=UPI0035AE1578
MDSPTDLFRDSPPQMPAFGSSDLPGGHAPPGAGRPAPPFRPPGFPLIHHLLQVGGAARRTGGHLSAATSHRHPRGERKRSGGGDEAMEEEEDEEEDGSTGGERRHGDTALVTGWSHDLCKVGRRRKLENRGGDGAAEGGGRRSDGVREGRRREREELKEQLEEARERLQALQEKVWRAFGEKHLEEEERRKQGGGGGGGGVRTMSEEDASRGMYEDDEADAVETEKETLSLLSDSPFHGFHKRRKEGRGNREAESDMLEGGEGAWLEYLGVEDEADEGGVKFARALKVELGSAVARVIDRVLRLYGEAPPPSPPPPAAVCFLPPDSGDGEEEGAWMGLLARGRGEEKTKGTEEKVGEREEQLRKLTNQSPPPRGPPPRPEGPNLATAFVSQRSPDLRKAHPLLGPPLSSHLNPSHPNLPLHHHPLPRAPSLSHPPLLPPASQPKDPSSSFHPSSASSSSSSSSFPAPPPPPPPLPLPLPLLHYSMQQLFSRSLHHPQLPHLPPSRKDYLTSDPFLEFSSHPSFPPLPLLGHLDPSLGRHPHGGRERERGIRDGGMRGGMDGGELYLTAGGTQEGLSPCHLKKAKLMFFYSRYPSSNTLKTYFPDVKFNRCVTSQMIKWFSNFREFFYIQMERFARQAVREALTREGAPRPGRESQLRVGRDTELYRILNMHYNKSNIYQVPDRFLEISEVALREFYSAIWTGKDSDPCWKKGIYKIICKLDCPVPDSFRLPGCPVG